MLGWNITKEGEYRIDLPRLSEDEELLLSKLEGRFLESVRSEALAQDDAEERIAQILTEYARKERIYLDKEQERYLIRVAFLHLYGSGFLEPLLSDPTVEEISIIGINKPAYVYIRSKGWQSVNAQFTKEHVLAEMINKISQAQGRRITLQTPKLNAALTDGSRLHATLHPISEGEITIRKFRQTPYSMPELAKNKTLSTEVAALLWLVMQSDSSVLVCGNTASGKTTLLNALFSFVPANERIVITEETPEINVPHLHKVRLVANQEMNVSLLNLVQDSLRMRPDRLIVGEVRTHEETHALFDALLGGQARGCYATFHAQSVAEAKRRIIQAKIAPEDVRTIDCVIVQRRILTYDKSSRTNKEIRRLIEIEVFGENVLSFDQRTDAHQVTISNHVFEELGKRLGMTKEEIEKEYKARMVFLAKAPILPQEFYTRLQTKWYTVK